LPPFYLLLPGKRKFKILLKTIRTTKRAKTYTHQGCLWENKPAALVLAIPYTTGPKTKASPINRRYFPDLLTEITQNITRIPTMKSATGNKVSILIISPQENPKPDFSGGGSVFLTPYFARDPFQEPKLLPAFLIPAFCPPLPLFCSVLPADYLCD